MVEYENKLRELFKIELNYEVEKILYKDVKLWPLLEIKLFSEILYRSKTKNQIKKHSSYAILNKIKKSKCAFYGFINIFKKNYDYILFTDTLEKRLINGVYIDKIAQGLIDIVGQDNFLIIENPVNNYHYPINKCQGSKIISTSFFYILAGLFYIANIKNIEINNEEILQRVLADYNIEFNYKGFLKQFLSLVNVFEWFFIRIKPKFIFINCYYSLTHMAAIYAAKKQNIKVIELQHGIINNKHYAYNFLKDFVRYLFPDYLFVYGKFFRNIFQEPNLFINKNNVYSVGSYYIEKIKKGYIDNNLRIRDRLPNYKKIVVISSQNSIEESLLNFVLEAARKDGNIFFIFRPRNICKEFNIKNFPKNFYLSLREEEDIYKLLKIADIHVTVYSTVCLEALCFGVPNIMINMDDLAKLYFGEILNDKSHTIYVNTVNEFINAVNTWQFSDKKDIIKFSRYFFEPNHRLNVRNAIEKIVLGE